MKTETGFTLIFLLFVVAFVSGFLMMSFPSEAKAVSTFTSSVVMPILALIAVAGVVAQIIKNRSSNRE